MGLDLPAIRVYIRNYQQVRDALEGFERTYRGAFRDAVQVMLLRLRNYASYITHRESGTLARSHSIEYDARRLSGFIYPSPRYIKQRYGGTTQAAAEYAIYEHSRGGSHAFYARALAEMGPRVGFEGINAILTRLPSGTVV